MNEKNQIKLFRDPLDPRELDFGLSQPSVERSHTLGTGQVSDTLDGKSEARHRSNPSNNACTPVQTLSDAEIRSYAKAFTRGLLNGRESDMWCYMVSAPLAGYLNAVGVKCEAVEGVLKDCHHYWVEFPDGRIIDATAAQFGLKNVWLQPRPSTYSK